MDKDDMPRFQTGDLVRLNSNVVSRYPRTNNLHGHLALVVGSDAVHYQLYSWLSKETWWCSHNMRHDYHLVQGISRGGGDE
jgi:hypothetical protein